MGRHYINQIEENFLKGFKLGRDSQYKCDDASNEAHFKFGRKCGIVIGKMRNNYRYKIPEEEFNKKCLRFKDKEEIGDIFFTGNMKSRLGSEYVAAGGV